MLDNFQEFFFQIKLSASNLVFACFKLRSDLKNLSLLRITFCTVTVHSLTLRKVLTQFYEESE